MSNSNPDRRFRIALLTALDVLDRLSWSGTFYYMARALQKHCGDITFIGPMEAQRKMLPGMLLHQSAKIFLKKNYMYRHTIPVSKYYAHLADQRLAQQMVDVVIALCGATELAFLETNVPTILIEDANFALLKNYHAQFSELLGCSARQLEVLQTRSIDKASLVVYSTAWAANSAIENYEAGRSKLRVIPFGANLEEEDIPPREKILARRRNEDCCRLLFVGVDWEKKGASIALEALVGLEKRGIPAELTVCGCVPPRNVSHPKMRVIPFLNKNNKRQRQQLEALYMQSDFFILPTRNDCFGIVFCEASAFGLPSLATCTGGVSEVVKDGVNGFTLPYDADGSAYADIIARFYYDAMAYHRLVQTSRYRFETLLNWDVWGETMHQALSEMLVREAPSEVLVHS
jgi:glycosyltransferase involved in cell wall biosynthesis